MPHATRTAVEGLLKNPDPVACQMSTQLMVIKRTGRDADVIDIAATGDRRHCLLCAGMGDVPQDDQRRPAPDLLHSQRWIRITGPASHNVEIEFERTIHIVDQKHDVINANKGERGCHVKRLHFFAIVFQ